MNTDKRARVTALYQEVQTLSPERREAYLQNACGDDPEMMAAVQAILLTNMKTQVADEYGGTYGATIASGSSRGSYDETVFDVPDQAQDPLVGKVIDGYRIESVLGQGGMGVVYKARNQSLNRVEALKVIAPFLVRNEQFLRRFQLEAQALAKIHHPNIVTVYTLRQSQVGHYITMEFVEGQTLADLLNEDGPWAWQEALPLIKQLLAAFDYAHERGIIHRDIKPRNILLNPDGTVKVMDFGLAKFYLQEDVTQSVAVSGTLCYMSPEQIKGLPNLDQRSDIFALGITLYELLAGQLPFQKDDSQFNIQRSIVEGTFPAPDRFNKAIPSRLSKIIMKALEKEPEDRYQHVAEMLAAIQRFEREAVPLGKPKEPEVRRSLPRLDSISKRTWLFLVGVIPVTGGLLWGAYSLVGPGSSTDQDGQSTTTELQATDEEQGRLLPEEQATNSQETEALASATGTEGDRLSGLPDPRSDAAESESTTRERTMPQRQTTTPSSIPPTTREREQERTQATPENGSTSEGEQLTTENTARQPNGSQQDDPQEPETAPAEAKLNPAVAVLDVARPWRNRIKEAILKDAWGGLPGPIAAFYKDKLKDMSRKFEIKNVGVELDDSSIQTDGTQAILPVTVRIDYQQKGRDGLKSFPIPSLWTWKEEGGKMVLVNVRDG